MSTGSTSSDGRVPGGASGPDPSLLSRIARLFRPYRGRVALVGGLIVTTAVLGIVNPLLIQRVFDDALFVEGGPRLGLLFALVGLMVAVPIVSSALEVWQTLVANRLGNRVMQDLRNRLFAHLQSMELAFFTTTRTGEIQSRLGNDVTGVQTVITDTASTILGNVVTVASALVAMIALSWQLTLVSLAVLPLFVFLQIRVGRMRRRVADRTQQSLADMTAITQETLSVSGILLTKVFNRQSEELARFRRENARQAELQVEQVMTGQWFFAVVSSFFSVLPAIIYLVAGLVLGGVVFGGAAGGITAGVIVAFTTLQSRILFPTVRLLRVAVEVQTSLALFARLFEYLDLEPAIVDAPDAVDLDPGAVAGHVRFEHVWFRYPDRELPDALADVAMPAPVRSQPEVAGGRRGDGMPGGTTADPRDGDGRLRTGQSSDGHAPSADDPDRWVLRDLDLEVRPGQLAAFVGPSGAGKTTASHLIPRLYEVTRGAVRIDGRNVREVTRSSLAEAIGVVTQDTYLFHASVADNLRYGRPDADDEELVAAATAARIHGMISTLPDGYGTLVGERGYRMSGGEQQRLAIARVLLKDPRILILDEATSNLDTTNERLVQEALEPLLADRTTIAIAHRLSTVLAADVIFVLDRGRIVERGTHAELVAADGLYTRLYEEQFAPGHEVTARDGALRR